MIWCVNGAEISSHHDRYTIESGEQNSTLVVPGVQQSDQGEYSIKLHNQIGEDKAIFVLLIKG